MIDERLAPYMKHPKRAGIFCSYDLPDIRIIMLDVRYYRTHSRGWNATMLGYQQERWFWDQLDNDKRYTIVGSGTCVNSGAKTDNWKAYRRFYQEFSEWVVRYDRVLVVSGDIHYNKFDDHGHFHEAVSSGVGRAQKHKTQRGGIRWGKNLANYGILDFLKTKVKVRLKGRLAKAKIAYEIRTSDWTAKRIK